MTAHPDFTHHEGGTPEAIWAQAWRSSIGWTAATAAEVLQGIEHLVCVSAHPDDESLGAAAILEGAHTLGVPTTAVVLTAGEGSHPSSPTHTPEQLARRRREEARAALSELNPDAETVLLDLPDGQVTEHADDAAARIVEAVMGHPGRTLVVAPWESDGHPDHEAAGRAASAAAFRTDAQLLQYPIWLWHWGTGADLPWSQALRVELDAATQARKQRALAAHASQVEPLSSEPGDEPIIGPAMLVRAARDYEVYLRGRPNDDALDRLHAESSDPWDVENSWYERRKRALTLASLTRARYGTAVEVGCSVGRLAQDLAERVDRLVALDSSPAAVRVARSRLSGIGHVDVREATMPADWPDERPDLVVLSEVGYFLSPRGLRELVTKVAVSLADDGEVVACHWRHPIEGWPLRAADVHQALNAHPRLRRENRYLEDGFVLEVWRVRGDQEGDERGGEGDG